MNTITLQNMLISKITEIKDDTFLKALNTILDSKSETIMILSEQQKESVKKSQKEYLKGQFHSNDTVNEEMEKWLKE
ncbi:MAG: hypothetical protein V4548_03740 [Bacteroidota bacterium]